MDKPDLRELLLMMYKIRFFEEEAMRSHQRGLIHGGIHLYLGQEAIAAGVCAMLEPTDYIASTHRGHGHCLAKGGDANKMMAELYGRVDGYCRGRGGSMHICDLDIGILGADGIVGGSIPMAVGAAFSSKYLKNKRVTVSFFGDGASNQGSFHESITLAALWKLPLVFVCENNLYAISLHAEDGLPTPDVADRAKAYGIEGVIVDGMDILAVRDAAGKAVEKARNGDGPTLLECKTYRYSGHHFRDPATYRKQGELERWQKRDPIDNLRFAMLQQGYSEQDLQAIVEEARQIIEDSAIFASNSPVPESSTVKDYVQAPL